MTVSSNPDPLAECDQASLIALIPTMRAFARFLCRDPAQADDLTQDALVSAWRSRASYLPGTNMKAWVFTIIRNRFYSDQRRSWRVSQLDQKVAEETLVAVTSATGALELEDVRRAMLQLSEEQQQALALIAVGGLGYTEAAMVCNCAEGTIKSRVSRARQRLTEILAEGDLVAEPQVPGLAMASMIASAERARLSIAA
jgi:RNA polymerase sigma-70 factor (ECF subfamily)